MRRREFLAGAAGAGFAGAGLVNAQPARKPNVVLIMADDFGYECLGCNGATTYKTPNLDALARRGVRYTNTHSTPLCTPTRVQLMTGKYNHRNYTEFGALKPGEFTFAHMMQKAGYRTCAVGKWQLAGSVPGTKQKGVGQLPEEAGFDEHCLWQVKTRGERYWDPVLVANGKALPEKKGQFGPDVFAEFATQFMETNRARPFFLYYPMALTHDPFLATPRSKGFGEADKRRSDPKWFADFTAYMDEKAGQVIAQVDKLGLGRETLILFTGDNGTHPSITTPTVNGPYKGGKGGTLMNGTHVPLITAWRGRGAEGKVNEDLIDFTDVMPTMAEAAGASMPEGHPRDGRSFLAQIEGKRGNPREWIFCHYEPRWGGRTSARWVMDKRWKLYGDGRFFDLQRDVEEKTPIAELTPEMRSVRARFEGVLAKMKA